MERSNRTSRCDECESFKYETLICLECEETLCKDCDRKVHNKGTRVRHSRFPSRRVFYEEYKKEGRFRILYFSPECYHAVILPKNFSFQEQELAAKTFEILIKRTKKGFPMTLMEELVQELESRGCFPGQRLQIEEKLEKICQSEKIFNFTIRKFGMSKMEKYLSLGLSNISVEALGWIVQSIKKDQMQPSQSLIHSRIKEYFGIKIGQKEWKKFVENLTPKLRGRMNYYKTHIKEIKIRRLKDETVLFYFEEGEWEYQDFSEVATQDEDYKIFLTFIEEFFAKDSPASSHVSDMASESGANIYKNKPKLQRFSEVRKKYSMVDYARTDNKHRKPRSMGLVGIQAKGSSYSDSQSKKTENIYSPQRRNLVYGSSQKGISSEGEPKIKSATDKDSREKSWTVTSAKRQSGKGNNFKKWLSSVEKPYENSRSGSSQNELNVEKMLQNRNIAKAIPGGKYGCALMIKHCGPEGLREKSIGRILALIKKSLDEQILIHWKTLLVKNDQTPNKDSNLIECKIHEYKRNVIELLCEHREGISLAQFKQYYNRKFPKKTFDFEDLRYAKLTDFLRTMEDYISIEKRVRNNNVVYLRKDVNPRAAMKKYSSLIKKNNKRNFPKKIYRNNPSEEYGHPLGFIQHRSPQNINLPEDQTNIYIHNRVKNQMFPDYVDSKHPPANFPISSHKILLYL